MSATIQFIVACCALILLAAAVAVTAPAWDQPAVFGLGQPDYREGL